MTSSTLTRLSRASGHGRPAAPVRIVHLGVGNFFRAHQAWYTEHAPDADQWGIAAFTGRSAAMADALRPQDGLYTLITRGAVTETAGFGRTSGFIDDTRAFLSIPSRHDLSRRVDAGYLAKLVGEHRLTLDEALDTANELVVGNPRKAFKL